MIEKEITITNETGLHSRPVDLFVRTSKLYKSSITVCKGEKSSDAKNIVKMLILNVLKDDVIVIKVDGEDEAEAMDALVRLVESDFTDVDSRVAL